MSISQFQERVRGRDLTSEDSIDEYTRWIERFLEWHGQDEPIDEGALRDFDTALDDPDQMVYLPSESYSYSSRVKAISAVKKWADVMRNERIRADPNDLVRGDRPDFDPEILPADEVDRLLEESCDHPGCLAARNLGYDAIMRAAELPRVRPEDVQPGGGTVYVRGAKGSQSRHIGVSDRTMNLLVDHLQQVQQWFANPSKVFYTKTGSKGITRNGWTKHFSRSHCDAGFHSFARHTAITRRLEDGQDFYDVYLRARHEHPSMTAKYASIAGRTAPGPVR